MAMIFVFTSLAFATGPASVYKVKIKKVRLWNGASWVTVYDGLSGALDIASAGAGASAGNFLTGLAVPDGTYTQVEVTPSATMTYSGHDGANYTTAVAGPGGGSVSGVAAAQAEFTVTLPVAPAADVQDFSATPITVLDGGADHTVRVSFDVANAIDASSGEVWPAQPAVTMSII